MIFSIYSFKSGIQMNTGSDKWYFLIQNSPSYNIQAWEMSFASLNYLNCATIPSGTNINQLYYVNSSLMFLSGTDSTSQNLYLLLFNFNSVSIEWSTVKPFV